MKYLIASDIHGSKESAEKIIEISNREKADKIILLGDLYYHGPRNVIPDWYDPKSVSILLNGIKEKLIVVKGNCDAEVDQMISEFDFLPHAIVESGGKLVFLTHGHVYNKENPPKTKYDGVIYGHLHTGFLEKKDGTLFVNAGSVTLPKNDTPKSYVILEKGKISLYDLNSNIIAEETL